MATQPSVHSLGQQAKLESCDIQTQRWQLRRSRLWVGSYHRGDGKSGKIFHQSLLTALNLEAGGKNTTPLVDRSFEVPAIAAFTPPLEQLLKFSVSSGFLISEGWQALSPAFLTAHSPYDVAWAPPKLKPCTTRISLITVEEDNLQAVLKICREHKTTLTALAHALTLLSLSNRLHQDKALAFEIGTPICLRHLITANPPPDLKINMERTVVNSVAYWMYHFDKDLVAKIRQQIGHAKNAKESTVDLENTIYSVATTLRQELTKKLESGAKNDTLGLTKLVGDWRTFVKDRLKKPRTTSWEVSNLGVLDGQAPKEVDGGSNAEQWTIERAIFTQSATITGPALCINPIAVKGKGLTMTNTWQIEVVDDELALGVSRDLETWLNILGKTGHIPFVSNE